MRTTRCRLARSGATFSYPWGFQGSGSGRSRRGSVSVSSVRCSGGIRGGSSPNSTRLKIAISSSESRSLSVWWSVIATSSRNGIVTPELPSRPAVEPHTVERVLRLGQDSPSATGSGLALARPGVLGAVSVPGREIPPGDRFRRSLREGRGSGRWCGPPRRPMPALAPPAGRARAGTARRAYAAPKRLIMGQIWDGDQVEAWIAAHRIQEIDEPGAES